MTPPAAPQPTPPDPAFPRLTRRPLPAYRFLNTGEPHPVRHADGHSYLRPEPNVAGEAAALAAGNWQACPEFCYGVDLYNYAYWWEAHEAWEAVWQCYPLDSAMRHVLQGFIQVSAAHLQHHRGIARGSQTLLARARQHLTLANLPRSAIIVGVEIEAWWRDAVTPYFAGVDGAAYPFIRLG